jgi:hypothetical protein
LVDPSLVLGVMFSNGPKIAAQSELASLILGEFCPG